MKTITLRLTDTDHQRLSEAASKQRMPMTSYLLRLFDIHMENVAASQPVHAGPKTNKRDQAFIDYHALMDSLPLAWNDSEYKRVRSAIEGLRVAGGNIAHTEMPLPRAAVDWHNITHGGGLDPKYSDWTVDQLQAELQRGYNASVRHFLTIRETEAELGISFDE